MPPSAKGRARAECGVRASALARIDATTPSRRRVRAPGRGRRARARARAADRRTSAAGSRTRCA
eukprot:1856561-Prymnesium_polylepis.1